MRREQINCKPHKATVATIRYSITLGCMDAVTACLPSLLLPLATMACSALGHIHGQLTQLRMRANALTCRHPQLGTVAGGVAQCPDCHQKLLVTWVRVDCTHCHHTRQAHYTGWGTVGPTQPNCPQCHSTHWALSYRHQCNYFTARGALKQMLPLETLATQDACMSSSPRTSAWVG